MSTMDIIWGVLAVGGFLFSFVVIGYWLFIDPPGKVTIFFDYNYRSKFPYIARAYWDDKWYSMISDTSYKEAEQALLKVLKEADTPPSKLVTVTNK